MTFEKQRRYGLLIRNLTQYIKLMERNELDELYIFTYGSDDVESLTAAQRNGTFPPGFHVLAPPKWLNSSTGQIIRSEEHTSELQSLRHLVCRLLLEKKKK